MSPDWAWVCAPVELWATSFKAGIYSWSCMHFTKWVAQCAHHAVHEMSIMTHDTGIMNHDQQGLFAMVTMVTHATCYSMDMLNLLSPPPPMRLTCRTQPVILCFLLSTLNLHTGHLLSPRSFLWGLICYASLHWILFQAGKTPLLTAAFRGWADVVEVLTSFGADVNHADQVKMLNIWCRVLSSILLLFGPLSFLVIECFTFLFAPLFYLFCFPWRDLVVGTYCSVVGRGLCWCCGGATFKWSCCWPRQWG